MTTPETLPEVITVPELAALLRVSKPTAYAAVKRGEIPGLIKIGNCLRLNRAAVLAWMGEKQGCVPRDTGGDQ
jgi:excisionase family DNA binding protein